MVSYITLLDLLIIWFFKYSIIMEYSDGGDLF